MWSTRVLLHCSSVSQDEHGSGELPVDPNRRGGASFAGLYHYKFL